jgi:F420-non-reducing hydrogenase iron-sulfur subunit
LSGRQRIIKYIRKVFSEMKNKTTRTLAIFYCQNVPGSQDEERQSLEEEYGKSARLFPMPCSGRIDVVHLLRSLEEYADAVYAITCPPGACRYHEGNKRIIKRVDTAKKIIESIGLEKDRIKLITPPIDLAMKTLRSYVGEIVEEAANLEPSPVHGKKAQGTGRKAQGKKETK